MYECRTKIEQNHPHECLHEPFSLSVRWIWTPFPSPSPLQELDNISSEPWLELLLSCLARIDQLSHHLLVSTPNLKTLRLVVDRSSLTYRVCWRLNSTLSSWAKYHDICSLSDTFRASTPLTDCLIHLRLTPTGRRWAGTARPIWSSSLQPSVLSKNMALVSRKCSRKNLYKQPPPPTHNPCWRHCN